MCSDHYEPLVITLFKIVQSRWFSFHLTQLERLFRMSYHLYIRIFYPKNELAPPYCFSVFKSMYLGSELSPRADFGVNRLSSMSSFEWHIICPNRSLGPMNKFYHILIIIIVNNVTCKIFQQVHIIKAFYAIQKIFSFFDKFSQIRKIPN